MLVTLPVRTPTPLTAVAALADLHGCRVTLLPRDELMLAGPGDKLASLLGELETLRIFPERARGRVSGA